MSDVFSQSRASSLVQGFENATPVWIVQAQPCVPLTSALSVSIRVIRGSLSLPFERLYQTLIHSKSRVPAQVFAHGFAIHIQQRGQLAWGAKAREAPKCIFLDIIRHVALSLTPAAFHNAQPS
jgi:branched-subunit amino acid ABC-type transport system permease component